MQLLTSWKDGLLLAKPDQVIPMLLIVAHACKQTFRLYTYFWWLFIPSVFVVIYTKHTYWPLLFVIPLFLLIFVIYLAVRPSTLRKQGAYFLGYGKHFFWFFLFFIIWLMVMYCVSIARLSFWSFSLPLYAPLLPFFSITTFFLLDTDGSFGSVLKSVYRGVLFLLYNLPICLIIPFFFLVIAHYSYMFFSWADILMIGVWPLPIALYNTLYIKRVHEQFQLYFGTYHAE